MRRHLERYTPEICSQLRRMAEQRQWTNWQRSDSQREQLLEDLELTYHLHIAAEAAGARKGMPPMPSSSVRLIDSEGVLDPVAFINRRARDNSPRAWNHSDNAAQAASCN